MKVLVPKINFKNSLFKKRFFISISSLFLVGILVYLQNRVLPSLLSTDELTTQSQLLASQKQALSFVSLPVNIVYALYWFTISLTSTLFNPAYVTGALFMVCVLLLLLASLTIYRRIWPTFVITLLFGVLAGSLSYSYGLKPELVIIGHIYLTILGFTLLYRRRNTGLLLLAMSTVANIFAGLVGIVMSGFTLIALAGFYIYKPSRRAAPQTNGARWAIIGAFAGLIAAPLVALLLTGFYYDFALNTYDVSTIPLNLKDFTQLIVKGSAANPFHWSSQWPLFSLGGLGLFVIGVYALVLWRGAMRNKLLLAYVALGVLLPVVLGLSLATLAPFVAITPFVMVAGLRFLHEHWLEVFPLNTTAHKISVLLLSTLIVTIGSYHINRQLDYLPQLPEFNARYTYQQSL